MQTTYVASGDFQLSKPGPPEKFVALLGTCVGVAIFDKKSRIGGLCHILLPQPNDPDNVWQPKNYATTALPLFVDELLQAGAKRENFRSVVAGGSLCGPISNRDIILDIGGKNLENALKFLERHSIPVIHSETGGCQPMSLVYRHPECKVSIHSSESQVVPSGASPNVPQAPPSSEELSDAIQSVKPIPQIALKLTRTIQEGDYNIQDIVRQLEADQVMSAKLISYCNSAFFGFKVHVDTVLKAISLLGETYLLEAVISAAVNSYYDQERNGGYALVKGGLFKHSICVAHLARILARTTGAEDEHTAYTAGLLHDIGKVVLDQFVCQMRPAFYSGNKETLTTIIQRERSLFATDHQQVGEKLASDWKLPKNLLAAICSHHTPSSAQTSVLLTHIIAVADVLAAFFMAGIELECVQAENFEQNLRRIGLSRKEIPDILNQVPWTKIMYS